ncbi:MAG: ribulose-5-phosphate 4-epimerase-like epimerase or aldolase [Blastococcus sp.]|jgi:L-ribulose-5-phosphate 4-epimerase|nr:ribulose-5-phosphate 4-epimerase-like epimerase or aldolase [Blastococcus sp.]
MSHPTVQELREQVVTCTRLLVFTEILDYSGHVSARIPGEDLMLIQPRDASRATLAPADLLVVDFDGTVVEGTGIPVVEWPIHAGAYRARADVAVVLHGHPTLSTTFSMVDRPLVPMRHFFYKYPDGLAIHPDSTHIVTLEQGDALAKTLGTADACLIRSHGTLLVARRIQELFMDALDLEENARTLITASQLGNILPIQHEEAAAIGASYGRTGHRPNKVWEHYLQKGRAVGVI